MGRMYYGNSSDAIEIDDVDLAHLRMVAMTKLRRSEGFSLTFSSPAVGRTAGVESRSTRAQALWQAAATVSGIVAIGALATAVFTTPLV